MSSTNALLFAGLLVPWIPVVLDHFFDNDN